MSYYHRALAKLHSLGNVYVCGTGIDEQVRASLAPFSPIYYEATPIEHFRFIQSFNRVVLSNSTFAWWAAFLSDAEEIIGPRSQLNDWMGLSGDGVIDLALKERRYREIDVKARAILAFRISEDITASSDANGRSIVHRCNGTSISLPAIVRDSRWFWEHLQQKKPISFQFLQDGFNGDRVKLLEFLTWAIGSKVFLEVPAYLDSADQP